MFRLLSAGHHWRKAAAVGSVAAIKLLAERDATNPGDGFHFCQCERLLSMPATPSDLSTRSERLAQHKIDPSRCNAFNLKQSYEIIRVLGEGAFGMVYHARDKTNGKDVALKAMPREFTGQTDFEREVAALQLLSEKNDQKEQGQEHIVQLYSLHRDEDNYYLAMEMVEGGELLDHLIAGGPFSEGLAARFLRQFAEGISYTHAQGLVHADLKPENLLLTHKRADSGKEETSLKLVDFGCACTHDTSNKDLHLPAAEFAIGCSFLHMVALGNQFELQRMLMERPSLVNFRDYDFRTPLHLAASEGHVDICRFLVAKGAKINRTDRWGNSSLDDAHRGKHTEVLKYLRQHGAKFGDAATQIHKLIEAAGSGNIEVARTILEFGSALDINQGDYDRRTALHLACSEGRLKMVELLLSQEGIDVDVLDRWGNKPIDDAKRAKYNSGKIIDLLKARGARSDDGFWPFSRRKTSSLDTKDENNQTSAGTVFYWPPEMFIKGAMPTPAIDMWAAGVISYMVLTGTHPFDKYADMSDEEMKDLIMKFGEDGCNQTLLDEVAFDERVHGLSESCIEMLKQLLHPDPEQRMTSKDFVRHPWIQGLTARDEKMDETYKRHLINTFKKRVSTHFARNGGKEVDLREIFNSIDVAGNGVLDANEIRMALRSAGEKDDVVTNIISSLDFKRQGCKVSGVTFDEFMRIMSEED